MSFLLLCLAMCIARREAAAQTAAALPLRLPTAIAYDAAGNLFIADAGRHQVLEATLAGTLLLVAGNGVQGFAGDGGAATSAELNGPQGLAFGTDGTLYIADTGNARIRAVSGGVITTSAGTGVSAFGGDGGPALAASFRCPTALAMDRSGALLVADTMDHRVRRVLDGTVATLAGDGVQGFGGDGGPATEAELDSPSGLAAAADGRVFIADTHNQRVRLVTNDGTIRTFAGTGQRGFAGDGNLATAAALTGPRGLALTSAGALLIADADNERVRSVSAAGLITTEAGAGTEGTSTDGNIGAQVSLHAPRTVVLSAAGMPVFADVLNGTVRVLTPAGTLFQPAALAPGRSSNVQLNLVPAQTYGQVTASVAVSGMVGTPLGTAGLSEGTTSLGTVALSGGAATLTLPSLAAGAHTLTATYAGDGLNPAAAASGGAVSVSPLQVTAVANAASMEYGATLPALSGSLSGVLPQDAGQVSVVFSTGAEPSASVGSYPIIATLAGAKSGNYTLLAGAASGSLTVTQAASAITLSNVPPAYVDLPLRLSANVASATSGRPTGTVQFLDGTTVIATAALVNGSASTTYTAPSAGTLRLTAQYVGDLNFEASSTAPQMAKVNVIPDFTVGITGAATATVPGGSIASFNLLVSAQASPFTGVVTLSASGLPAGATAVFSPVQVVPGTGSATVAVSVQTVAPAAALSSPSGRSHPVIWALVGVVCCFGRPSKGRKKLIALLGVSIWLCGCGARNVAEADGVLTSQTYSIQLTGTSTNLVGAVVTHATPVTLVVQN